MLIRQDNQAWLVCNNPRCKKETEKVDLSFFSTTKTLEEKMRKLGWWIGINDYHCCPDDSPLPKGMIQRANHHFRRGQMHQRGGIRRAFGR